MSGAEESDVDSNPSVLSHKDEEEAIKHEREERVDVPPPWENRMFLR